MDLNLFFVSLMTKCFAIIDLFVYMFFFLSLKTLLFCYGVWIVEKIPSSSLTIIFHNQWTFKCTRIKDLFTYDKNKYTCNYQNWDRRIMLTYSIGIDFSFFHFWANGNLRVSPAGKAREVAIDFRAISTVTSN